jgi:hypothetical protein
MFKTTHRATGGTTRLPMFEIREDQIKAFTAARTRENIAALVTQDYEDILSGMPRDLVFDMVDGGIATARSFGLSTPEDLAGFVCLMFEIGPEFYRQPNILKILQDNSIEPQRKLEELDRRTTEQDWNEARDNLAEQSWFPELRGA